jgi:hypothetical protein
MSWILRAIGFLVALMFIGGAAAINGATAWHLGTEDWQRYVFAGIVVGAVICEALGVLFVKHHWQAGNRLLAVAGVVLMFAAAAYTVRMELRFFTESHSGMSGTLEAKAQSRRDANADIAQARKELSWIPQHRASSVVQTDLVALRSRHKGSAERYCAMKARWAGKVCRQMKALESELAIALQAVKLKADIQRLETAKRDSPVVAETMPEAAWLSRCLPVSKDGAADWLMVGGILFLLLARTFALPLAMTGSVQRELTQLDSGRVDVQMATVKPDEAIRHESTQVDATHVAGIPCNDDEPDKGGGQVRVLDFTAKREEPGVSRTSLDQFLHELQAIGGGNLAFPEIVKRYERYCRDLDIRPEARNYLGKRLKDLGFRHRRRSRKRSGSVTYYQIPPLMQEAA